MVRRRVPSEHLLQAIAKSLQVGLVGSMRRALVSHIDEGGDKLDVGRPQGFSDGTQQAQINPTAIHDLLLTRRLISVISNKDVTLRCNLESFARCSNFR